MTMERPVVGRQRRGPAPRRSQEPGAREGLRGSWRGNAACQYENPDLFFDGLSPVARRKAKAVCYRCPVMAECLRSAMAEEAAQGGQSPAQNRKARYGIRGGLTSGERWSLAYPGEKPRPDEAEAS